MPSAKGTAAAVWIFMPTVWRVQTIHVASAEKYLRAVRVASVVDAVPLESPRNLDVVDGPPGGKGEAVPCVSDWLIVVAEWVMHRDSFEVILACEEAVDFLERRRMGYFAIHLQHPRRIRGPAGLFEVKHFKQSGKEGF